MTLQRILLRSRALNASLHPIIRPQWAPRTALPTYRRQFRTFPAPLAQKINAKLVEEKDGVRVFEESNDGPNEFIPEQNLGEDIEITSADEARIQAWQKAFGISDEMLAHLVTRYPGIEQTHIEQIKEGKLQESQLPKILYPDGKIPPQVPAFKDLGEGVTEEERELAKSLVEGSGSEGDKQARAVAEAMAQDERLERMFFKGLSGDERREFEEMSRDPEMRKLLMEMSGMEVPEDEHEKGSGNGLPDSMKTGGVEGLQQMMKGMGGMEDLQKMMDDPEIKEMMKGLNMDGEEEEDETDEDDEDEDEDGEGEDEDEDEEARKAVKRSRRKGIESLFDDYDEDVEIKGLMKEMLKDPVVQNRLKNTENPDLQKLLEESKDDSEKAGGAEQNADITKMIELDEEEYTPEQLDELFAKDLQSDREELAPFTKPDAGIMKDIREMEREYLSKMSKIREKPGFWNYEEPGMGEDEVFQGDDLTSMGHGELEQHREIREYARYAAWEMPLLSKLAKPFELPQDTQPLRFRYTTYMGEQHPAERKVVLKFAPRDLQKLAGLSDAQVTKMIKICGTRYNPETELVKMSCDRFETQAQNKRYLGDLVDKLIAEAKDASDMFEDVPIDTRHHRKKPWYQFPEKWLLTPERKKELEDKRKDRLEAEERRELEGGIVDGLGIIANALRGGQNEPQPVMVGAGARRGRLT